MEQTFNEKCPKCKSINWKLSDKHNNCYCLKCSGYFGKDDVRKYWKENQGQLNPHENYAAMNITRKPKPVRETGQFPWRCPICRTKTMHRDNAVKCIDNCWKKVKEIRKSKNG